MSLRTLVVVVAVALTLTLGVVPAAHAADYPPTAVTVQGSGAGIPTPNSGAVVPAGQTTRRSALPFTGGNAVPLMWAGVAILSAGAFVVSRSRRRARAS